MFGEDPHSEILKGKTLELVLHDLSREWHCSVGKCLPGDTRVCTSFGCVHRGDSKMLDLRFLVGAVFHYRERRKQKPEQKEVGRVRGRRDRPVYI